MAKQTVDLVEASRILKLSEDAVRKRIQRGTISAERDLKGKWWVTIEGDQPDVDRTQLAILQKENELLKQQKQLQEGKQPSWWRRIFGKGGLK